MYFLAFLSEEPQGNSPDRTDSVGEAVGVSVSERCLFARRAARRSVWQNESVSSFPAKAGELSHGTCAPNHRFELISSGKPPRAKSLRLSHGAFRRIVDSGTSLQKPSPRRTRGCLLFYGQSPCSSQTCQTRKRSAICVLFYLRFLFLNGPTSGILNCSPSWSSSN